jgi:hypothetical protein
MRLDADGNRRYIGQRAAGIRFSETLEQTTEFDFGGKAPWPAASKTGSEKCHQSALNELA